MFFFALDTVGCLSVLRVLWMLWVVWAEQGKTGPITIDQYDVLHSGGGSASAPPAPKGRSASFSKA